MCTKCDEMWTERAHSIQKLIQENMSSLPAGSQFLYFSAISGPTPDGKSNHLKSDCGILGVMDSVAMAALIAELIREADHETLVIAAQFIEQRAGIPLKGFDWRQPSLPGRSRDAH